MEKKSWKTRESTIKARNAEAGTKEMEGISLGKNGIKEKRKEKRKGERGQTKNPSNGIESVKNKEESPTS